jgi:hypothetical protein
LRINGAQWRLSGAPLILKDHQGWVSEQGDLRRVATDTAETQGEEMMDLRGWQVAFAGIENLIRVANDRAVATVRYY